MEGRAITLCGVPALVWGGDSARCILAVHGMMSHKADTPIRLLAEVAAAQGIQVVSIDLPGHGDRAGEMERCTAQYCTPEIRRVLMQLVNGFYSPENPELFRDIYDSLLNTKSSDRADTYFILKDFRSYAEAHKKIDQAYRNSSWWAKAAILNVGHSGKFTSDRTIEEYVRDIWHLKKITVEV